MLLDSAKIFPDTFQIRAFNLSLQILDATIFHLFGIVAALLTVVYDGNQKCVRHSNAL